MSRQRASLRLVTCLSLSLGLCLGALTLAVPLRSALAAPPKAAPAPTPAPAPAAPRQLSEADRAFLAAFTPRREQVPIPRQGRVYYKRVSELFSPGDLLRPYWCRHLVDVGRGEDELLVHEAWKLHGQPAGLPSRLDCVFASLGKKDWDAQLQHPFIYKVRPLEGACVTVRDATHLDRVWKALQARNTARTDAERSRLTEQARAAARDYWTKPADAPGALPEVLLGGGAVCIGTLNDPD